MVAVFPGLSCVSDSAIRVTFIASCSRITANMEARNFISYVEVDFTNPLMIIVLHLCAIHLGGKSVNDYRPSSLRNTLGGR